MTKHSKSIKKTFQPYNDSSKNEILELLTQQTEERSESYLEGIKKRNQNLKRKKFKN